MIFQGDARQLMSHAEGMKACITDPIWPNHTKVFDCEDSAALLWTTLGMLPKSVERVVIVLGGDSDPRWLREGVPMKYPFLKSQFLEFCCPMRKGRNLYTNLMAYCFGAWPAPKKGQQLIPTKGYSREVDKRLTWHPTPLRVSHCKYLVRWWGEGGVVDPFAGSGSIGVACKELRTPYVGFEINETYAKKAWARIEAEATPFL